MAKAGHFPFDHNKSNRALTIPATPHGEQCQRWCLAGIDIPIWNCKARAYDSYDDHVFLSFSLEYASNTHRLTSFWSTDDCADRAHADSTLFFVLLLLAIYWTRFFGAVTDLRLMEYALAVYMFYVPSLYAKRFC